MSDEQNPKELATDVNSIQDATEAPVAPVSAELAELREIRYALTTLVTQMGEIVQLANHLGAEADKLFGGNDGKAVNPLSLIMGALNPRK